MSATLSVVSSHRHNDSLPAEPLTLGWPSAPSTPEAEPVDMARLRDVADDDPAGMRDLVDMYLAESVELMDSLRCAMRTGLPREVERVAHKLGGSSATCGMNGIVAPLRELERSGKAGQWPENEQLLQEATRQHERICAYLAAHVLKN